MSFYNDDQPVELSDVYQGSVIEEPPPSATEKIIALILLLGIFVVAAIFNFDYVKHFLSLPQRAYKNYVISHAKEFPMDYKFKQASIGKYKLDINNAEVDPRATHFIIHVWSDQNSVIFDKTVKIQELALSKDDYRVYNVVFPKETKYVTVHFFYFPEKGDDEEFSTAENFMIATNYKRIFFDDVRGDKVLLDKPEYNLITKVKTYDEKGQETKSFRLGDKIYVKVFNYTLSSPNGNDHTSGMKDHQFDIFSANNKVVLKMPKMTDDYLIFSTVDEGSVSFTYLDGFCTMKDVGRAKVKGRRPFYYY